MPRARKTQKLEDKISRVSYWSYCFICSGRVDGRKKGLEDPSFSQGHQVLLRYLLKDHKLETSLFQKLLRFVNWDDDDKEDDRKERKLGKEEGLSSFDLQFCSGCKQLGNTLHELETQIEAIQKVITNHLTSMKAGILSSSRLYGGGVDVQERFQNFEGELQKKELAGIGCERPREFLELLHQFQTFVFENADYGAAVHISGSGRAITSIIGSVDTQEQKPVISCSSSSQETRQGKPNRAAQKAAECVDDVGHDDHETGEGNAIKCEVETHDVGSDNEDDPLLHSSQSDEGEEGDGDATYGVSRSESEDEDESNESDEEPIPIAEGVDLNIDLSEYYQGGCLKNKSWLCEVCNVQVQLGWRGILIEKHLRQHETDEKIFSCNLCSIQFSQKQYFAAHVILFHRNLPMKCDICAKDVIRCDMRAHLQTHSDKVYPCPKCGCSFCFGKFESLVAHVQEHKTKIEIKCQLCPQNDKMFDVQENLPKHLYEVHEAKQLQLKCSHATCTETFYNHKAKSKHMLSHRKPAGSSSRVTCTLCPEGKQPSFATSKYLQHHEFISHGIGTPTKHHVCHVCSFRTFTKSSLAAHVLRHNKPDSHGLQKRFGFLYQRNEDGKLHCSVCNKIFSQPGQRLGDIGPLSAHYVQEHNYPPYECEQCPDKFESVKLLVTHHRKHKRVGCSHCSKTFRGKTALREHETIHAGTKEWTCELCGYCGRSKLLLRNHMHRHATEADKKHVCSFCPKRFVRKAVLRIHERTHTGEKPFQCDKCDKAFSQATPLVRHVRRFHPEEQNP